VPQGIATSAQVTPPSQLQQGQATINGAGTTFPFPLINRWRVEYQQVNPSVNLNYQSIGSGGGIRQFTEKTVDFGATDAPLTENETKALSGSAVPWPTGLRASGNEGVANTVKSTPILIGYVELAYALTTDMNYAFLENKAGNFVEPSLNSTQLAVETAVSNNTATSNATGIANANEQGLKTQPSTSRQATGHGAA
jgi:ABC-type phosphate transport system substrate-binding protein